MKHNIITLLFIILITSLFANTDIYSQGQKATKINWLSLDSLDKLYSVSPKPILIDLYTDWCTWRKVMDRTTYSDERVIDYLNEYFYAIKFDAESEKSIKFFDTEFNYGSYGEMHDFAVFLTNGKLAFPTTIVIPTNAKANIFPGYLKVQDIEILVKYYGTGSNNSIKFKEFNESFVPEWKQ